MCKVLFNQDLMSLFISCGFYLILFYILIPNLNMLSIKIYRKDMLACLSRSSLKSQSLSSRWSRGFNQCVQNRNRPEPCTPWTSVLVYICFCGGIMKIAFFNFHDNFQCLIIFLWKIDINSISNSKCKYERIRRLTTIWTIHHTSRTNQSTVY